MSGVGWVDADDLIELNRAIVADTGEPFQLRDLRLLESAVARPQHIVAYHDEQDIVALGSALAVGIAQNHPFAQGNKRTAQAALFRFLWINGYTFREPDDLELAELLIAVVDHQISEEEYCVALDRHVVEQ